MKSDISQSLEDLIVIQTSPIIEDMESRHPEAVIARAVGDKTVRLIREALLGDRDVEEAINRARVFMSEWDYLQTLGSAIDRDNAKEKAERVLGQRIAVLLDIDLDDLLRSRA